MRKTSRRGQEELEHVTHIATEALAGHRIVKAFGAEAREAARFAGATQLLYRTNMKITSALSALPPMMEFIGGVAGGGGDLVRLAPHPAGGVLTPGDFSSFLTAAFMMYGPIKKLSRVNASLQQAIAAAAAHLRDARHAQRSARQAGRAGAGARARPGVEFRDVGFAYDDEPDRFILRHVSFSSAPGRSSRSSG